MLVSLEGLPAAGKSTLATEIVACVTTGRALYGAAPTTPHGALWIGHEEGLATALRPRLNSAGADASRVFVYKDPPSFPSDYKWLTNEIRETGTAIVVIDPIDAYLDFGDRGDSHRNGDVRARLRDMSVVAEQTGATIIMVRHFRKSGGVHAVYRSAGSLAFSAQARAIISVVVDPVDPSRRVACWTKMSDAPEPSSLAWSIGTSRRVRWIGQDQRSAADLISAADDRAERRRGDDSIATATDRAETWLANYLAARGEAPAAEVLAAAAKDGVSERTLRRAQRRLGVRPRRESDGQTGAGRWLWVAPDRKVATRDHLAALGRDEDDEPPQGANDAELRAIRKAANAHAGQATLAALQPDAADVFQTAIGAGLL
jgi:hypothetical protein